MTTRFFARSFLSFFLIVCVSLMNVNVALADDPVPPTATAEPTQEPTEEAPPSGEEPVATETPVVSTETSVSGDPSSNGEQPPAESEAPITELLSQLPEDTSLVVLDENGNPVPLASQDAAEIVIEADPIWCPATAPAPIANAGGCTQDFPTPAALLAFLQANQGNPLYQQAGVIYLESANVVNVPVFIDAALFPTLKNFALTVKGGWNNVNNAPVGNTTTFDNNNNAYLHIGSNSNPWVGNVTIQDIFIQDNTVNNTPSIQVYTTNGNVTLNNVDTDDIDDSTAINVVVTGTGNVNLTGVDVSDGTDGSGITVTTNSGNITLADVDVTNQSDGNTANLQSQTGNINITNGSSNGSTFDGGTNSDGFVATTNTGTITITGANGGGNQIEFTDADGTANGATLSAPTVVLTRVTADDNDMNGIQISNANSVTLNNVIATNNGTDISGAPDLGSGVRVIGTGTTIVTVTGGTFNNNERYPIEISNGSVTIISNPTMTGNDQGNSIIVDNTPPAMSPTMTCSVPGNAGWCRGTVNINWNVSDPQSAVNTTGCQTSFSTNTPASGTALSCSATSTGGTTNGSVTVYRDATAPNATGTKSPAANGGGWNNTDVTVTFTATDTNSGVASCTAPVTITTEGANQPVSGSCTDVAGNTDNDTVTVSIDKTAPVVNASIMPAPNANGWNSSGVLIVFSGTDSGGSGIPMFGCTPLFSGSSSEGANQTRTGTCTDRAGNVGTNTVTLNIDLTNPVATATKSPAPNANGWNNTDVVVTFSGTDVPSGIASCTAPATVSTEGTNQSRSGNCTDLAGRTSNTATANNINIDKTAPAITFVSRTPANGNGWNNGDVTVTWSCTDALSGVVTGTVSQTITSEGANQTATGTCQDRAGNTSSNTQSGINIDKTAPTLTLPSNMTVEATGASGAVATYTASASDLVDASVPVTCSPASGSTFALGTTTVNCSGTDDAGNTTNGSFTVTVQDTTAPSLNLPANITEEATSPAGASVTYSASALDLVDGVVTTTCSPVSGSTFALGVTTVNCSATDANSNNASGSFTVTVEDTTAPTLTLPANITVEATGPTGAIVTYSASASDLVDASVTFSCSPASGNTFAIGTTTVNCSGTDDYSNTATGSFTVTVQDTTVPVLNLPGNITAEATSAAGASVTYTASASDVVDGVLAVTCSPISGGTFALGVTTVNCSATDSNSNTTNGSFTVTVQDTTAPVIAPHADVTTTIQNIFGSKTISYTLPSTTDAVDGIGTATCSPASGSSLKVGDWTVTCTATDSHGNVATPITFVIHVKHEPATVTSSAIIPVTGGETIELDCNTRVSIDGIKVIFYNLCDQQAVLTLLDANTLPGALPAGLTFVKGLNVRALDQGQVLETLPVSTGIEIDFPSGNAGKFTVLFWDNGKWIEITQSLHEADIVKALSNDASNELYNLVSSENGKFKMLTTEFTGTFILVKK